MEKIILWLFLKSILLYSYCIFKMGYRDKFERNTALANEIELKCMKSAQSRRDP